MMYQSVGIVVQKRGGERILQWNNPFGHPKRTTAQRQFKKLDIPHSLVQERQCPPRVKNVGLTLQQLERRVRKSRHVRNL